jgi:hypothetical protein
MIFAIIPISAMFVFFCFWYYTRNVIYEALVFLMLGIALGIICLDAHYLQKMNKNKPDTSSWIYQHSEIQK